MVHGGEICAVGTGSGKCKVLFMLRTGSAWLLEEEVMPNG